MSRALESLVVGAILVPVLCAQQVPEKAEDRFKSVVQEYQASLDAFDKAFQEVKGDAQRDAFFQKNYPPPEQFYPRLLTLARKYPKEAAAAEALIWIVNHSSPEAKDEATQQKALETLRRDHLASDKLPQVFERADDTFLRAVLEASPHRHVRGLACYSLAEKQLSRVGIVSRWRAEYPDWRRQWKWLEKTHNAYLVTTDIDVVAKESEKLLERVTQDFPDVPIDGRRNGKNLGTLAKGHLHEIRQLAIGKKAPELKSVDLAGNTVRLADLRGKVVVLDVWATWCGPCRAMIPHQRALVKRLGGKPFALVSICVDEKRETLSDFLTKEAMPWTHWYEGPNGKIIADLNVFAYPRVYVVDAEGVIRYKDVRGKLLDQAVASLLSETERSILKQKRLP